MKHKIVLDDFHYQCGDGCCDVFGTSVTIDGVKLYCYNMDVDTILFNVLHHLGIEAEIVRKEEE